MSEPIQPAGRPSTVQADSYDKPEPRVATRKVPPLVWIIVALLVVWFAVALVQRKGADHTPQGGSTPAAAEGTSVMPAAPANGSAPATPAGVVNGDQQAPPR